MSTLEPGRSPRRFEHGIPDEVFGDREIKNYLGVGHVVRFVRQRDAEGARLSDSVMREATEVPLTAVVAGVDPNLILHPIDGISVEGGILSEDEQTFGGTESPSDITDVIGAVPVEAVADHLLQTVLQAAGVAHPSNEQTKRARAVVNSALAGQPGAVQ